MNKRYRLCDVEEAVSEMDELMDIRHSGHRGAIL